MGCCFMVSIMVLLAKIKLEAILMRIAALFPHPPLIIPGVGGGDEVPDTRAACRRMADEICAFEPDTIVILSPHSVLYGDYFHISPGQKASGSFAGFRAPQVRFEVDYDSELATQIGEIARENGIEAGFEGERDPSLDHGTMVPLYYLCESNEKKHVSDMCYHLESRRIVRLSLSGLDLATHYRYGRCIRMAAERLGRKVALVASGDMSHKLKSDGPYGFCREGAEHDAYVRECLQTIDFKRLMGIDARVLDRAAECGFRSLITMAGYLDGVNVDGGVLSYEGPYGVGYLCASFHGEEDAYVRLARRNVEHFVQTGREMELPGDLPGEMMTARAGIFVSIKSDGKLPAEELRGCIGTIAPTCDCIADEIIQNGISAASHDPRFAPITPTELASLSFSVDVLKEPETIDSIDKLDVKKYGVIVTLGRRRGLLLPNLEGIDDAETQVSIAARKGGIGLDEPYELERFEVRRHK